MKKKTTTTLRKKKVVARLVFVLFVLVFLLLLLLFNTSNDNNSENNGHHLRNGRNPSSSCDDESIANNKNKEEMLDRFRRAWLVADDDDDESSYSVSPDATTTRTQTTREKSAIINSFKGPLTLHSKLGPKLPKVPKANGEMEDLGLVSKLDAKNLPERDALEELREREFKTCAVVGNGGSLLLYEHGDVIDAHDAVFRFNDGTGKEPYSKYAGTKTTVRLVNSQHRGYRESEEEIVLQHLTAPAHLKLYVSNRAKKLVNAKDYALSGAFYSFVKNRIDKKSTPTNGMYGLYLAQSVCEKITIFGFARQWYNATRYHYHNDYEPTGSQNARDSAEMIPLEKLVRDKPTKVMFGEPCVGGGGSSSSSSSSSSRSSKERKEFPRFKTCAVVGTSGTLKEKALGEQIDKHEAVIRTDLGRIVGFEKDVGARTTFDFAAANDLRNLVSNKNAFAGREEDDDVEPEDDSELENENEGAKMRNAKRRRRRNALHPQTLESIVARNSTIVLHELFSRAALRGTYPPFIRAFEQLRRSEEEKGGVRVDIGGVPSVAAIEPRLLVRILQTFHRVANALDQNSHETGAPSGARDISSSSRAPISIVATLFALQICDKVNAFGLAPPLAVQSSSSSSGKLDASSSGDEKIGRTRPTYRNYWDRNFAHVGTLKKHGLRDAGWEVARAIGQWPCSGGQLRVIDPKPTVKE